MWQKIRLIYSHLGKFDDLFGKVDSLPIGCACCADPVGKTPVQSFLRAGIEEKLCSCFGYAKILSKGSEAILTQIKDLILIPLDRAYDQ